MSKDNFNRRDFLKTAAIVSACQTKVEMFLL